METENIVLMFYTIFILYFFSSVCHTNSMCYIFVELVDLRILLLILLKHKSITICTLIDTKRLN